MFYCCELQLSCKIQIYIIILFYIAGYNANVYVKSLNP